MTKTVCDFCGFDYNLTKFTVPRRTVIEAKGGKHNVKLMEFAGPIVPYEIDLCDSCADKLARVVELFYQQLSAEGDKNAACDEKAASAEDLRRKMMEDATSYKIPCAHPIEQVQKTYCPQEGIYEYYCHNCGERWWIKKHE